ncbi:MAG: DUF421 domain-containing protein [Bacilli bacterium]|nr:DUF421 domain-containing protein [Bacilli bacterium]
MISDIINTNWYELWIVATRALFSLVTLFFITKMIGKKQVSELSLFDYVISISIGNFAAEMTMNLDSQVLNGLVSLVIFGVIATLVSVLTMKSVVLRRFFMGTPTIIIQDGKFVFRNLKKVKFDMNDFLETCRGAGYFDVSEIKYALMEANGKVSFLPKEEYLPVTNKDMNLSPAKQSLCANVIIDGKIMKENLKNINKDEDWLRKQLKVKGYDTVEDIILATVDINEKLTIFNKRDVEDVKNVLE